MNKRLLNKQCRNKLGRKSGNNNVEPTIHTWHKINSRWISFSMKNKTVKKTKKKKEKHSVAWADVIHAQQCP